MEQRDVLGGKKLREAVEQRFDMFSTLGYITKVIDGVRKSECVTLESDIERIKSLHCHMFVSGAERFHTYRVYPIGLTRFVFSADTQKQRHFYYDQIGINYLSQIRVEDPSSKNDGFDAYVSGCGDTVEQALVCALTNLEKIKNICSK